MKQLKANLLTDKQFEKEMDLAQHAYNNNLQIALYSTFTTEQDILKFAGVDKDKHSIYLIYGTMLQNLDKKGIQKFYFYLIQVFANHFDNTKEKFSIIFFNTLCDGSSGYNKFRSIYRSLPFIYFEYLDKIIIVHPNFSVKSLDWIVSGYINSYLKAQTFHIQRIQDLQGYNIKVTQDFLDKIKQDIREVDFPQSKYFPSNQITTKKPAERKKLFLTHKIKFENKKLINNTQTPAIQKVTVADLMKKKISDYEISDVGIPMILNSMVLFLKMRPQFLAEQGIFRKAVAMDEEQDAIKQIFNGNYDYLQDITDAHLIASIIKKFFYNLIQPIIPFNAYQQIVKIPGQIGNSLETLKKIFDHLPELNKITLVFLLKFFINEIIPYQQSNKMTSYNVAVVLLPCLMRSPKSGLQDFVNSKRLVIVLQYIIDNFNIIFDSKNTEENLYRRSSKSNQQKFEEQINIMNIKLKETIKQQKY